MFKINSLEGIPEWQSFVYWNRPFCRSLKVSWRYFRLKLRFYTILSIVPVLTVTETHTSESRIFLEFFVCLFVCLFICFSFCFVFCLFVCCLFCFTYVYLFIYLFIYLKAFGWAYWKGKITLWNYILPAIKSCSFLIYPGQQHEPRFKVINSNIRKRLTNLSYTDCNTKNYTFIKSYFWELSQDKFIIIVAYYLTQRLKLPNELYLMFIMS